MALRFLIGAAGTGKTEYCMKEIINAQSAHRGRQIFLVPEQYTSQAERDLTAQRHPNGGSPQLRQTGTPVFCQKRSEQSRHSGGCRQTDGIAENTAGTAG